MRAIYTTIDPPVTLGPETPLVHVPDTSGTRKYDGDANSVNAGDKVSWQIPVKISYRQYTSEHERWTDVSDSFSYEMPDKDSNFDKLHIRVSWASALLNNEQRQATFLATYDPGGTADSNGPFDLIAEFEKLGTYKVQYSITAKHDNNTPGNTNDDAEYPATGSYIFHVGPIRDLAVEDGGASSQVAADRSALTIVAANNGPDHSLGAQVTGLPTGAEVVHISQGSYDGAAGVWDIGELKVRGYYRSQGKPSPTLVLGAAAGGTANVTIASSKDYEVCVGGKANPGNLDHTTQAACEAETNASWNSTPVYDYNAGNNTATITAARGTGGVGPGVPTNPITQTGTTAVMWDRVEYLFGLPVERYEVQWLGSGWTTVDRAVYGSQYVDTAPSGRRDYRVRAVNSAGVAGPWSRSTAEVQGRSRRPAGQPENGGRRQQCHRRVLGRAGGRWRLGRHRLHGAVVVRWYRQLEQRGQHGGPDLQAPGPADRGRAVVPGGGAEQ